MKDIELRDYFAAKAMLGLIINPGGILEIKNEKDRMRAIKIYSYKIADEMMEGKK